MSLLRYTFDMNVTKMHKIKVYSTEKGKAPFVEWLEQLDSNVRYRIKERLDRITLGNFGDHKSMTEGIFELRFTFGSEYRVYYGKTGNDIVLLLTGGDKNSQKKDIKKAIEYWRDYLEE